ncbi:hypothetical protein G7072_04125 [Nocardioides sp. HDW12B]|uniref:hypothetical protein n=1 Tax=Nocardioides sp. HDW12B TaxID=2714939 RepID=UPI00140A2693|nr:hypothetical protein [Nocardioides sp. HDW12B]QIK65630.1 hypothetical protein G7072_04125 [Nocardioides sp. HDW12B]
MNIEPGERASSVRLVLRYEVPRDDREAATSLLALGESLVAEPRQSPSAAELFQPLLAGEAVVYELHLTFSSYAEVGQWIDRLDSEQPSRKMWDPGTPLSRRIRDPHPGVRLRGEDGWPVHRVHRWVARPVQDERSDGAETAGSDPQNP